MNSLYNLGLKQFQYAQSKYNGLSRPTRCALKGMALGLGMGGMLAFNARRSGENNIIDLIKHTLKFATASGIPGAVIGGLYGAVTKDTRKSDKPYETLHNNIKAKLTACLSDYSIASIEAINQQTSSEPSKRPELNKTITDINNQYSDDFTAHVTDQQTNALSRYVRFLDACDDSNTFDSMHIHAGAILNNCNNQAITPNDNHPLTQAKNTMIAAVAVSRVYADFEPLEKPKILDQFRDIKGEIPQNNNAAIDTALGEKLPEYMENYKHIIDHYGSAPFLVRTGTKGSTQFSHYGSVIVEKTNNHQYQVRFANPSSPQDVIHTINKKQLNNVLLALHEVYANGNPQNNLGDSNIGTSIFKDGVLNPTEKLIPRQAQTGMQCGIHSSRRIIPANIYKALSLNDCDMAGLVEYQIPTETETPAQQKPTFTKQELAESEGLEANVNESVKAFRQHQEKNQGNFDTLKATLLSICDIFNQKSRTVKSWRQVANNFNLNQYRCWTDEQKKEVRGLIKSYNSKGDQKKPKQKASALFSAISDINNQLAASPSLSSQPKQEKQKSFWKKFGGTKNS
jgi:hypothetical protein